MKKEFSFYEFTGLLIPGGLFLYAIQLIIETTFGKQIIDFSKFGETVVFLILAYSTGHLLQAVGNITNSLIWYVYGGLPTSWLLKKNRFGKFLFEDNEKKLIKEKLTKVFGENLADYGGLTYNYIYQKGNSGRADVFNGNFSLFKGLFIAFTILAVIIYYYFGIRFALLTLIPAFLSVRRMIRFAKYYATETFRTFYNIVG